MTYRAAQDSTETLTATEIVGTIVGQQNLTATRNPTTTDDCTAGYQVGSRWLNVSLGNWYLCTSAASGNATWTQVSGISEGDVPTIPLGSAEGVTTLQPFDGDTELDLDASDHIVLDAPYVELRGGSPADITAEAGVDIYVQSANNGESSPSGGAWLFSGNADGGASGDAGVGSGNSNTGQTGTVAVYTGDGGGGSGLIGISTGHATGGNSGNIGIVTGDADSGDSGNIELRIGSADNQRGSIILNAPNFNAPTGFHLLAGSNPIQLIIPDESADNGDGSGITLYAGPGGGGSGNGGAIQLVSGEGVNGNSGNIRLETGVASGSRGTITLNAPAIVHEGDVVATFGPDPMEQGTFGIVADSFNIMATNENDSNLGAWLFSADCQEGEQSVGVGIGSGNSDTGNTGTTWVYTGNSSGGSGSSGVIFIETGDVHDGTSGDITIAPGHVTGAGARGNIILDAALIQTPNVSGLDNSAELHFTSGTSEGGNSGSAGIESGAAGGNSGTAYLGSSDADGDSGAVWIYSGQSSGSNTGDIHIEVGDAVGNSGSIILHTGTASEGEQGSIILDGPMIKRGSGQWYADAGVGFDIECSNATDTAGDTIYMQGGFVTGSGDGGVIFLQAGDGGSDGGNGGLMGLQGGGANHAGNSGGAVAIVGGMANVADAIGGKVEIQSGQGQGGGPSGLIQIHSGVADTSAGISGDVDIWSGHAAATGNINLTTEAATAGTSGAITLQTGTATDNSGAIVLQVGSGSATQGGAINLYGNGNGITMYGGNAPPESDLNGGGITISGSNGQGTGGGGQITIFAGVSGDSTPAAIAFPSAIGDSPGGEVRFIFANSVKFDTLDTGHYIIIPHIPSSDPHVAGAMWADPAFSYSLKISQG